jgi:drug/metabolite transporter (DMT)-like permease
VKPTRARGATPDVKTLALTATALIGFAANSLLCRAALRPSASDAHATIDAASFTLARLASGAIVLALLARRGSTRPARTGGSWLGGTALFAYAIAFSFAYLRLGAGAGALILFGVVQATMLFAGVRSGERLRVVQWLGVALALGGLVWLTAPGLSAPDPFGAGLMALAGLAWGTYSLLGRGCANPLAATADNFARSVPLAVVASAIALPWMSAPTRGVLLAVASGALASGLGYSLWYAALRGSSASRAAVVQLCVPVLVGAGSVLLLGEPWTARLSVAGLAILLGIGLAVARR